MKCSRPPGFENIIGKEGGNEMQSGSFSTSSTAKIRSESKKGVVHNKLVNDITVEEAIVRFIEVRTKLGYGMADVSDHMEMIIKEMGVDLVNK